MIKFIFMFLIPVLIGVLTSHYGFSLIEPETRFAGLLIIFSGCLISCVIGASLESCNE